MTDDEVDRIVLTEEEQKAAAKAGGAMGMMGHARHGDAGDGDAGNGDARGCLAPKAAKVHRGCLE